VTATLHIADRLSIHNLRTGYAAVTATLHIADRFSIHNLRTGYAAVTETTYHGLYCLYRYEIYLSANSNIFIVSVPLL